MAALIVACAYGAGARRTKAIGTGTLGTRNLVVWIALAFVPSALLLGVTQHLTTDVVSAPLLWVVPLSLYLLTDNRVVEAYDREPTLWQPSQNSRPNRMSGGAVYELPFGGNKPFLTEGVGSKILGGRQAGGTFEYQPGALLEFNNNVFFNGDMDNIAKDNPEIALQRDGTLDPSKFWFNPEGFVTAAAQQPASYQKRAFPFRIDNLRGPGYFIVNANIVRNFAIGGGRSLQFRIDVQNLFDAVLWSNPTMDPTSTNFGKVTGATNSIMRFFTFVWKVNF